MSAHDADRRRLLLVAGTGRSGTSTVVGLLERHGFHVPTPVVVADESNPRGFGEPRWVVDLHGRMLRRGGVQVADSRPVAWRLAAEVVDDTVRGRVREWLEQQFRIADRLVVKDPRMLWFLPMWTGVGEELGARVGYVATLRPPPETVGSRRTYYNRRLEDPHGIASWLNLMVGTERATRGRPRAFVRYHDLLEDWRPVVEQVWRRTGLDPGGPPVPNEDPGAFIDPGLRRMRLTWDDLALPDRLERMAAEAWEGLDALAATEAPAADDPDVRARLDGLHRAYADYYAESESVAHSSVIAARQAARASRGPEGASRDEAADIAGPRTRRRPKRAATLGMLPGSLRRRLPARWRERFRKHPTGRG